MADAEALPLAIATQQAVEFVGMPEARIPLAHATVYMCRAKKNREAYESLGAASEEIENGKNQARSGKVEEQALSGQSVVDAPLCEVRDCCGAVLDAYRASPSDASTTARAS